MSLGVLNLFNHQRRVGCWGLLFGKTTGSKTSCWSVHGHRNWLVRYETVFWLVVWNMNGLCSISYMGCHPNPIDELIFFKMVKTTNQVFVWVGFDPFSYLIFAHLLVFLSGWVAQKPPWSVLHHPILTLEPVRQRSLNVGSRSKWSEVSPKIPPASMPSPGLGGVQLPPETGGTMDTLIL